MKRFLRNIKLAILVAGFLFACQKQSDLLIPDQQESWSDSYEAIPGQYIVVLNDDMGGARISSLDYRLTQIMMKDVSERFLTGHQINSEIKMVFSKTIRGFVTKLRDDELLRLRNDIE